MAKRRGWVAAVVVCVVLASPAVGTAQAAAHDEAAAAEHEATLLATLRVVAELGDVSEGVERVAEQSHAHTQLLMFIAAVAVGDFLVRWFRSGGT